MNLFPDSSSPYPGDDLHEADTVDGTKSHLRASQVAIELLECSDILDVVILLQCTAVRSKHLLLLAELLMPQSILHPTGFALMAQLHQLAEQKYRISQLNLIAVPQDVPNVGMSLTTIPFRVTRSTLPCGRNGNPGQ